MQSALELLLVSYHPKLRLAEAEAVSRRPKLFLETLPRRVKWAIDSPRLQWLPLVCTQGKTDTGNLLLQLHLIFKGRPCLCNKLLRNSLEVAMRIIEE